MKPLDKPLRAHRRNVVSDVKTFSGIELFKSTLSCIVLKRNGPLWIEWTRKHQNLTGASVISVFRSSVNKAEQDLTVRQKSNASEGFNSALKRENVVSKDIGLKKQARRTESPENQQLRLQRWGEEIQARLERETLVNTYGLLRFRGCESLSKTPVNATVNFRDTQTPISGFKMRAFPFFLGKVLKLLAAIQNISPFGYVISRFKVRPPVSSQLYRFYEQFLQSGFYAICFNSRFYFSWGNRTLSFWDSKVFLRNSLNI